MGASCSCFRQSSSSQRLFKEDLNGQNAGIASPLIEFVKPGLFSKEKEEKNTQLHLHSLEEEKVNEAQGRTLEDWLLASPGLNKYCSNNRADECHVLMKNLCHKVHPSVYEDGEDYMCKSSKELLKMEQGEVPTSQSGNKRNKRVSFRLPEESDIFIFYSPVEHEEYVK